MILHPDDMSNGMFVTVLDIKEERVRPTEEENSYLSAFLNIASSNPSYSSAMFRMLKGAVLRIDAINFPYIIVTAFEHGNNSNITLGNLSKTTMPLDTRKLAFMKLSNEYIIAYLGESIKKEIKKRN